MSSTSAGNENSPRSEWQVGDWRVHPRQNELLRKGETARLEPKAMQVLVHLAERAGEVVGREELLSAVWPGVVVGDDTLTQAIIKLRKALGDDAHRPKFIETISKSGYRLIAPVERVGKALPAAQPRKSFLRRNRVAIAVAGGVVAIAIGSLLVFPEIARTVGMPWPIVVDQTPARFPISLPIVAVLPLANLSGDPKRDYFTDGLTEDIIGALGRFSGLRVISRNSVEPFKTRPATPKAVRDELGVRYVVTGSVREADGRLRVAVELSDAEKGTVLWSDRLEGEGKAVFDIQDRIVKNIVGTLAVQVTGRETERAASKPPEDLEAYDLVLRARALLENSDRVGNRRARELLAKALEKEPNYAEAHVVLANAEFNRSVFGWTENPPEAMNRAIQLAQRAVVIGDQGAQSRAHGTLGRIFVTVGRLEEALAEADRAIELNSSDAAALDARAMTLLWLGRIDEAIAAFELALRFDPGVKDVGSGFHFGIAYYMAGRHREALAIVDRTLQRHPDAAFVHAIRAAILAELGNETEARHAVAEVRRLDPFFRTDQFGSRFAQPENQARMQEGLRKAGL